MKIRILDVFLASFSGILTALSFPKWNLSFLAWISLIPLFFSLVKKSPKQSFLLGLIAGSSFYAVLLYWIPSVPAHYGNLSYGFSLVIYIIFFLFLGLFWALFSYCASKISQNFPRSIVFLIPFLWISFEYILTYFLTGFPWGLLGYSQHKNLWFIQMAALAGVYGLSFVLVAFQYLFVFSMTHRKKLPFLFAVVVVLLIHLGGCMSIKEILPSKNNFKASVIQGNVSSDIYWDSISTADVWSLFFRHLELSQKAYEKDAKLIIWPEFSVPLCFSCPYGIYQDFKDRLFQFVQDTGCTLLLGTNETVKTQEETVYHNTALCLHPDLTYSQYYKMHLVPFGEYTPYERIFSFIKKMTHAIGEITPGKKHIFHEFDGMKFGSPICYEIIFPNLVRKFVKRGAVFLATVTNDGWYGKSSAPYQHFSIAVFRAVENRRYVLRAATTGISGIIDPYGRILAQTEMMTQDVQNAIITPVRRHTFYTKHGDFFPIVSLTFGVVFLILAVARKKNGKKRKLY